MKVRVVDILIPDGSTIGFGRGYPEGDETKLVYFAGDHRALSTIGSAMVEADAAGLDVLVEVPDYAVLAIRELP